MKSKRNQYLLLGLVIVIWAGVIYRFVNFADSDDSAIQPIRISSGDSGSPEVKSNYKYYLNYADPFLKTSYTLPKVSEEPMEVGRTNQFIAIPPVEFIGIVSSAKKKAGLVRIGGQSKMINIGDNVMDFEIKDIEENRIKVRFSPADTTFFVYHPSSLSEN